MLELAVLQARQPQPLLIHQAKELAVERPQNNLSIIYDPLLGRRDHVHIRMFNRTSNCQLGASLCHGSNGAARNGTKLHTKALRVRLRVRVRVRARARFRLGYADK